MIEGKVAAILSARELIINRGSADGVVEGMKFEILDDAGRAVVDPETGESLGSLQRAKVRVEAAQVEKRFAVARTYESWRENIGGIGITTMSNPLSRILEPPRWVTHYKTLKTSEETWEPLKESESAVKTGDGVRQLPDDEGA